MRCRIVDTKDEALKALIAKYGQKGGLERFLEKPSDVLPVKGNEDIYKHYNLLNANGTLKQLDPNTKKTKDWIATLNMSDDYSFTLNHTTGGYSIVIHNKNVDGRQLSMFQKESYDNRPPNKSLDNKIVEFLNRLGIQVNSVEKLNIKMPDGTLADAVSVAKFMERVVEVVEGKRKIDTLGEEAAHFLVEMMGEHPIVKAMLKEITGYDVYREVKASYSGVEGYDENTMRKEAVGKMIAKILVAKTTGEKMPEKMVTKWEALRKIIEKLFRRIGLAEIKDALRPFEIAADKILNADVSDLYFSNIKTLQMYQLSQKSIDYREKVLNKLKEKFVVNDPKTSKYYSVSDRRVIDNRVSDTVKKYYTRIFKSKDKTDTESVQSAHAGIAIHKLMELIFNRLWNGESIESVNKDWKSIRDQVEKELREVDDFKIKDEDYFKKIISSSNFKEFSKTVKGVIGQINEVEERIAKTQGWTEDEKKANKATAFTELSIYDAPSDTAGTIDLLVVHSNGAVSLFDWKSMIFDSVGSKVVSDVQWYKRGAWDIQLGMYKKILQEQYGVSEFGLSRLVPINIRFEHAGSDAGIKRVQTIFSDGEDPHLNLVPSVDERTGMSEIDKKLDMLSKKRNDLLDKHLKNRRDKRVSEALSRIDNVIKALQLKHDVGYVQRELASILNKMELAEHETSALTDEGKPNPNYMDYNILNDYREFAELFRDYANVAVETANKQGLPEEEKESLKKIEYLVSAITSKARTKTHDGIFSETGVDIERPSEETSFLGKIFNRLSQFKNPMIRAMSVLVKRNYDNTKHKIDSIYDKLKPLTDELKEWASSNGLSIMDAFKLMYDSETGNLHRKMDKAFKEDLKKARKNKDVKWFEQNMGIKTTFNEDEGDVSYAYTGKSEELFKKKREGIELYLKNRYGNLEDGDKKISELMSQWDYNNNVARFKTKALFSAKNQVIRMKEDNQNYNTKEWSYIQSVPALKKYYDGYVEIMDEISDLVDVEIDGHFVANVQQTFLDSIMQGGGFGPGALKDRLLQSLQTQQDDKFRGVLGNTEDNKTIPLMYSAPIREPLSPKEKQEIEEQTKKDYPDDKKMYDEMLLQRIKDKEYEKGRKLKSIDLSKTLLMFAEAAYLNNAFRSTEGAVKALRAKMADPMQTTYSKDNQNRLREDVFTHKLAEKFGIPSGDAEVFDKFMDMYWYGISGGVGDKTIPAFGREFSAKKLYNNLMQYIAMKAMGLKPLLAVGNIMGATSNAFMLASEGRYFTSKQLLNAQKRFVNKDAKWSSFVGFFEPYAFSMTLEKARSLSASKLTGWITADNLYILMRKGDEMTDNSVLLAMAQNYGVDPSDSKIKRLSEIKDKDVKSLLDSAVLGDDGLKIPGITDEEYIKFRSRVKTVSNKIKGSIPIEDRNLVGTSMYTSSMMMFKNWIPGLAQTRFKGFGKDEFDEFDVGRFSVAFAEFTAKGFLPKVKAFKDLLAEVALMGFYGTKVNDEVAKKFYQRYKEEHKLSDKKYLDSDETIENPDYLSFEDFKEMRIAKLRAMGTELRIYLSFMLALLGAKAMLPDDKDDPSRKVAIVGYRMINRSLLEVSFFLDPRSVTQITTNAIPQIRLMNDIILWGRNTIKIGIDDITGYVPKKSEKTRHRWYRTSKMFPIVSSGADIFDIWDTYNTDSYWKY